MPVLLGFLIAVYVAGVFVVAIGGYNNAEKMSELASIPRPALTAIYIFLGLLWPLVAVVSVVAMRYGKARS